MTKLRRSTRTSVLRGEAATPEAAPDVAKLQDALRNRDRLLYEKQEELDAALRKNSEHVKAWAALAANACCHPPTCGHAKFSECRNALVDAIQHAAGMSP